MKIAIDGPAASGKSSLGELLAKKLCYLFFDTGVMYRAVTLAVLQRGVNIYDETLVTQLADSIQIEITSDSLPPDGRQCTVLLDNIDVTWQIRESVIDANVSTISKYPGVREAMVLQQRRIASKDNVVMVGRDIGTVVLPDADIKVYLIATVEERARRRHTEAEKRGQRSDYQSVLAELKQRDLIDTTRLASPLKPANDAIMIDSTERSVLDITSQVVALVEKSLFVTGKP